MKLTKKLEAEILKVYKTYWEAYLRGDIKTFASMLDDDITIFGTAVSEVFNNKKDTLRFYKATADQIVGKVQFRNRQIRMHTVDNNILINEQCDIYFLMDGKWTFYGHVRVSGILKQTKTGWKLVHQHGSFPDSRTEEGEQVNTDKIKVENLQLRDAVRRRTEELENKNHELEIETALEKVRAIAMGMKSPADMLDVCKTISLQLQSLGVKDIRNVQTAILYESKGTYMNYEYYAKHRKTFITETAYTNHKVAKAFAKKMLQGKGEVYITHIKGQKVKKWIAYQKTTNVFIDRFLQKASSLNYYWHSLGPVALGVSTYTPLRKEDLGLFKRFLNVFELAYTRYLDIEQALAQAREAQIEASLEKVRAQALGMRKPEDLPNVCEVLFSELKTLGFGELRNAMVNIHNDEKRTFINYDYSDEIGKSITPLSYNENTVIKKQIKQIRSADDAFSVTVFKGNDLKKWKEFRKARGEKEDKRIKNSTALYYYFYSIGTGSIGISTFYEICEEKQELLKRFRNVFVFAYRRYMDVAQAEAQAKEAQIETALERVRSRTIGMQHSDELLETAKVVLQQLQVLGLSTKNSNFAFGIFDENKGTLEVWQTIQEDKKITHPLTFSFIALPSLKKEFDSWKKTPLKERKNLLFVHDFSGKSLEEYISFFESQDDFKESIHYVRELGVKRIVHHDACFSHGTISFTRVDSDPLSADELEILKRFSQVFEQTYTRFLDLQKAEAQAREAQIEVAMERIRARAMAMHSSAELREVANVLREQMALLDQPDLETSAVLIFDDTLESWNSWYAFRPTNDTGGKIKNGIASFAKNSCELTQKIVKMYLSSATDYTLEISGAKRDEWLEVLKKEAPEVAENAISTETIVFDTTYFHFSDFNGGSLLTVSYLPPSEEIKSLQRRAASVFDLAFRRFLDLQKAEAQAREAQIEAALERVRAKVIAMSNSNELKEISHVFGDQMRQLKIDWQFSYFWLIDEDIDDNTFWITWPDNHTSVTSYSLSEADQYTRECLVVWRSGEKIHSNHIPPEGVGNFLETFKQLAVDAGGSAIDVMKAGNFKNGVYYYDAMMKYGSLGLCMNRAATDEENKIQCRFALEFERAYTRFLDLQKAEAQARESQIQLAMERVRARTMAMQRSDELAETASLLFTQINDLGIQPWTSGFNIWEENDTSFIGYNPTPTGEIAAPYHIPSTENSFFKNIYEAKKRGEEFLVFESAGESLAETYNYMKTLPVVKEVLKGIEDSGIQLPTFQINHCAFFSQGFLLFITLEAYPEAYDIFKRFAKVFQQTYTRFLDLQKAEAQAREAQIEAALERVRSRTMAMQRSDELLDVASILFQQVKGLGVPQWNCGFNIWNIGDKEFTYYPGSPDGVISPTPCKIPLTEHPVFMRFDESRKRGDDLLLFEKQGEEQEDHYRYMLSLPGVGDLLRSMMDAGFRLPAFQIDHVANFSYGNLIFITFQHFPEMHDVFKRFAKVFEQTYTRFLDLQKAEAQAREAKIETSLEKVRSRTMAMQKSIELGDVATVLFKEMNQLVDNLWTCGFVLCEKNRAEDEWWLSAETGFIPAFYLPNTGDRVHENLYTGWKNGETYRAEQIEGAELDQHYEWLMNIPVTKKIFDDLAAAGFQKPVWQKLHCAYFSKGYLCIITQVPCPEEEIFKRFAQVFDLTYTRFLDLQKAEAQTREAQIETALEKVRSRTMAMQRSDELPEAANNLFLQVHALGIPAWSAGYCIWDEGLPAGEAGKKTATACMSSEGVIQKPFTFPTIGEGYNFYDAHKTGENFYVHELGGEALVKHYQFMRTLPVVGEILDGIINAGFPLPTFQIFHIVYFTHGYLMFITYEAVPDAWNIFQRFGKVFEQTYTRFLDLQHKEIQAVRLKEEKEKLEHTLGELQTTQKQLIQSEKMASLGELTAGIAHEIQNPLNFVNNFSDVNTELVDEVSQEINKGNIDEAKAILNDIKENEQKINHHGKRADAIIKGMLQHSRSSSGTKELTDINALCDEFLRLAFHGLRAKDKSFNAKFETDFDLSVGKINVMPQDIGRVILNLINNAFYAVDEKKKKEPNFEPIVTVSTKTVKPPSGGLGVEIKVADNGNGIPQKVLDKIFQPFFTTKPTGQGTGLGLSLSYDIVKAHGGEIKVETKEGEGTAFIILLPS
jgi:signal transduction histidine kinase/ketosteroid isomerase-like protein